VTSQREIETEDTTNTAELFDQLRDAAPGNRPRKSRMRPSP